MGKQSMISMYPILFLFTIVIAPSSWYKPATKPSSPQVQIKALSIAGCTASAFQYWLCVRQFPVLCDALVIHNNGSGMVGELVSRKGSGRRLSIVPALYWNASGPRQSAAEKTIASLIFPVWTLPPPGYTLPGFINIKITAGADLFPTAKQLWLHLLRCPV